MITQRRLKELLQYDEVSGKFWWRVGKTSAVWVGKEANALNTQGYVRIGIDGRKYKAHNLAWMYTHGSFPAGVIDHIDRNPLNNSISNLRDVTNKDNSRNRGIYRNNTSGVIGVHYCHSTGKWRAGIAVDGKHRCLGRHASIIEASLARLAAEQCLNWGGLY